jgi:hypothetical protein
MSRAVDFGGISKFSIKIHIKKKKKRNDRKSKIVSRSWKKSGRLKKKEKELTISNGSTNCGHQQDDQLMASN